MNDKKTQTKVIAGFCSAIVLFLFSMFIAYSSFVDLMSSVEYLAKPDQSLENLNLMLANISATENSIRSYGLTGNKKYMDAYQAHFKSVENNIHQLSASASFNKTYTGKADTLARLWEDKRADFSILIKLYQKKPSIIPSEKFFQVPQGKKRDTIRFKTSIDTSLTTMIRPVPAEHSNKSEEKEKEGFIASLKKIFSKKETAAIPSAQVEKIITREIKIVVDSSKAATAGSDTLLGKLLKKIESSEKRQEKLNRILSKNEMQILERNGIILSHIMKLIDEIKVEETKSYQQNLAKARKLADNSTIMLAGLFTIGMLSSIFFIVIIIRDLIKSNYYKNELIISKKNAEKLAKAKEEFLMQMSHEIRTPLNSIIGFTEQLERTTLQNKQKYFVSALASSSDHLIEVINNILDFSKIESGKVHFEKVPFSIPTILAEVCRSQQVVAEEKQLRLSYQMKDNFPVLVCGDPLRLRQVLLNLVSNAVKFTEQGQVTVSAEFKHLSKGISVSLSVSDTGIGIESEKLKSIFENFGQAEESTSRKYGGTGLGLAITKKIVELQQGTIQVQSTINKGSTFTAELQYEPATDLLPEFKFQSVTDTGILKNKKILVAEDDELNLLLLHTILQKYDADITLSGNGREALQYIRDNKYDLIITDFFMPEENGNELIRQVRELSDAGKAGTPILLLTANIFLNQNDNGLDAMAHDLLQKPFKEQELLTKVISMLSQVRSSGIAAENHEAPLPDKGYSIAELIRFSDADEQALQNILDTLLRNGKKDVAAFVEATLEKKWKRMAELAHKMYSVYSHLKVKKLCEDLILLQEYIHQKQEEPKILGLAESIGKEAAKILELVQLEIQVLEEKTS